MSCSYLRRLRKQHLCDGVVAPDGFKCRPEDECSGLSMHQRLPPLDTDTAVAAYQQHNALPHGDLPGICDVGSDAFGPGRLPAHDPVADDALYGHLHVTLLPCPDEAERQGLSQAARVLCPYVRRR